MTDLSRRLFLRQAAVAAPSLMGLVACTDPTLFDALSPAEAALSRGMRPPHAGRAGHGELRVYPDYPQISIPAGFHARLLSTTGDVMSDGNLTANAMDGMGAFSAGGNRVRLVRNHEIRNGRNDPKSTCTTTSARPAIRPSKWRSARTAPPS